MCHHRFFLLRLVLCQLVWALLTGQASAALPQAAGLMFFLEDDEAFRPELVLAGPNQLLLRWKVAPGYRLMPERVSLQPLAADSASIHIQPVLPAGKTQQDQQSPQPTAGQQAVPAPVEMRVNIRAADGFWTLQLNHQGRAEAGVIYPPASRLIRVEVRQGELTRALLDDDGASPPRSPWSSRPGMLGASAITLLLALAASTGLMLKWPQG